MEEKEIWKDIVGFEGLYEVSNMGRVKSLKRTVWNSGKGCYKTVAERILKPGKNSNGYLQVQLYKDGKKKMDRIHRLVATAFCENPHGFKEVNHIDEDKTNNCADNLEFCNRSYNNTYNGRANKVGKKLRGRKQSEEAIKKKSKPVIAINKRIGLILEFPSAREASRQTGISHGNIIQCCQGKYKSAGNFYWMYSNADAE